MKEDLLNSILAIFGGILLALMIHYNSIIAQHSTPMLASWFAHGIGFISVLFFMLIQIVSTNKNDNLFNIKGSWWTYLGGILGALIVILAATTVNSELGLSGTLALMLVGQFFLGLSLDTWGLLGITKRDFILTDVVVILLILTGSGLIIFL